MNQYQDWKPVVFKKNTKKDTPTKKPTFNNKDKKLENETENFKHKTVSLKLKRELQKARLSKKMNQKDLANLLNVSPSIINNYESGKAIPNNQFIAKMEQKLGVKLPRVK